MLYKTHTISIYNLNENSSSILYIRNDNDFTCIRLLQPFRMVVKFKLFSYLHRKMRVYSIESIIKYVNVSFYYSFMSIKFLPVMRWILCIQNIYINVVLIPFCVVFCITIFAYIILFIFTKKREC